MADLPSELNGFASFLDAQPTHVREVFQYCLCLMMIEAGKIRLVETLPGDTASISVFESAAGERFSVTRPNLSVEEESAVIDALREILKDEGIQ